MDKDIFITVASDKLSAENRARLIAHLKNNISKQIAARCEKIKIKEIEIPEGYEARIEGNRVIIEPKESEDERIRKDLITFICQFAPEHLKTEYVSYLEKQKDKKELDFAEGKVEGAKQACQEIRDAMSLYEPKDLTVFESVFRDYIDSAIRYCLSGEGYKQFIKEWAADLLNLEKQKPSMSDGEIEDRKEIL